MPDQDNDVKWLSYAELAESRGIDRESAVRLARRRKWRKQTGNDRVLRVAVPVNDPVENRPGNRISELEGRLAIMMEDADRYRARITQLEADLIEQREARAKAEGALDQARQEIERLSRKRRRWLWGK